MTPAALSLREELESAARAVSTDSYDMSIGEIINLYRDRELEISPEYQRLYRWDIGQKTLFIESLLLGIPIPPIFVFENPDSKWELIDGLQRVSTILQFTNELRSENGSIDRGPPLASGKYLPSLEGAVWKRHSAGEFEISDAEKIRIKRARIGVQILRRTSDNRSKYDLFQRLNSGGSTATRQELRNCMIVMQDPAFLQSIRDFSETEPFKTLFKFSSREKRSQLPVEYINRMIVLANYSYKSGIDVDDFFDARTEDMINFNILGNQYEFADCQEALNLIHEAKGETALHQRIPGKADRRPQYTALEVILIGVIRNLNEIRKLGDPKGFISSRLDSVWKGGEIKRAMSSGISGRQRLQITIPLGQRWFDPNHDIG